MSILLDTHSILECKCLHKIESAENKDSQLYKDAERFFKSMQDWGLDWVKKGSGGE